MATHRTNHEQNLRIIDQVTITSANLGIAQLAAEDYSVNGRMVKINGEDRLSFGSCSYLGLELDQRLRDGAIDAINRYGTQFSSSRAYLSITLYPELEVLLEKLFGGPVLLAPTCTLGHHSAIPVIIGSKDVVILDNQAHASIQATVEILKVRNIPIEVIRHNNLNMLEDRIKELSSEYEKIWYMCDGVYSMYGDTAPVKELGELMDRYEQLHVYADDSHGMSWTGNNGAGYFHSQLPSHPRLYSIIGLSKSFAACGGAIIFPGEQSKRIVRNCGKTLIFSGPIQPPMLGAGIASAKIHLSDEIYTMQNELHEKIKYFNDTAKQLDLPIIGESYSPIFFIGVGKPNVGYSMVKRLMNQNLYVNLSVFPSVSYNNTGIRICVTRHHTMDDIKTLLTAIADQLPLALSDEQSSLKFIQQSFKLVG